MSLANGADANDAVNYGQLTGVQSGLENEDLTFLKLNGTRSMSGDLTFVGDEQVTTRNINFPEAGGSIKAVSGAITLDGTEVNVSSKKIVSLANGTDATDAVNFGQLTGVQADIIGGASSGYDTLGKIENKIGFILSNVDESAIDSITEVISAFQNADSSLMAMVTGIQANVASISGNYATNAYVSGEVSGLDARLDVLEGANKQQQQYQAITLDSTDIDNQYLTVTNTIVGTPWVMIDGVMARPTADFTVSNNNRINFAGDLASLGSSALVAGDVVHVYYMKNALLGA